MIFLLRQASKVYQGFLASYRVGLKCNPCALLNALVGYRLRLGTFKGQDCVLPALVLACMQ